MTEDLITLVDERTGERHQLPIVDGTIRAADLQRVPGAEGLPLRTYDPGLMATATCRSAITFIDGDRGVLRYRGYPIEELAERVDFLTVAYLLLNGELPDAAQEAQWKHDITHHTLLHENIKKFIDGFHHDAHPMGILVSTIAALATFYPDARSVEDQGLRQLQTTRLIAKMPTLAAFAFRHARGLPYAYPDNNLLYSGNLLNMMWKATELRYEPDPALEKALDVLLLLHADHEQNCSTTAMRTVGSALADPYAAAAAAAAALSGPLHGGANEQVLRMLDAIGRPENVADYVRKVKAREVRLMGFGHRVYKNYDPRARIVKKLADEVFKVTGLNPLLEIAVALEQVALSDDYFIEHRLYPNVDFYTGIIYQAMGFPTEMFPVLFAIGRTPGWLAHWQEMLDDPDRRIARPRQVYTGPPERHLPETPV